MEQKVKKKEKKKTKPTPNKNIKWSVRDQNQKHAEKDWKPQYILFGSWTKKKNRIGIGMPNTNMLENAKRFWNAANPTNESHQMIFSLLNYFAFEECWKKFPVRKYFHCDCTQILEIKKIIVLLIMVQISRIYFF